MADPDLITRSDLVISDFDEDIHQLFFNNCSLHTRTQSDTWGARQKQNATRQSPGYDAQSFSRWGGQLSDWE